MIGRLSIQTPVVSVNIDQNCMYLYWLLRVAPFSSSSQEVTSGTASARVTGFRKPELDILSFHDHILREGYKPLPFPELADCEEVQ
jgi:hypothetical protein